MTEIGFIAPEPNNEYIEVFNTSYTETLDLYNLRIRYGATAYDTVVPYGMNALLPPRSYAVILEADYNFTSGIYAHRIPQSAIIVKIRGTTFGNNGMSNTSNMQLTLFSPYGDSIESYTYTANNSLGYSDEKINLSTDNTLSNWGNGRHYFGTPGGTNSLLQKVNNLGITGFINSPLTVTPSTPVTFSVTLNNFGALTASDAVLQLYDDANMDSLINESELLTEKNIPPISLQTSSVVTTVPLLLPVGTHRIFAKIRFPADEDTLDNISSLLLPVRIIDYSKGDVVINEIMHMPQGNSNEWVELYNASNKTVRLQGWKIADAVSSGKLTDSNIVLKPKEYLLLSRDSNLVRYYPGTLNVLIMPLPLINNGGDMLKLSDSTGLVIDSIVFSVFPVEGVSAERIRPEYPGTYSAWQPSKHLRMATPCRQNSSIPYTNDLEVRTLFIVGQPYIFSGSPVMYYVWVRNIGTTTSPTGVIKIYDDINLDSVISPVEFRYQANIPSMGPGEERQIAFPSILGRVGVMRLFAVITTLDDDTLNNSNSNSILGVKTILAKGLLRINEMQVRPRQGYTEWVEIYNNSSVDIDLSQCKIADALRSVKIAASPAILPARQYAVISSDSSVAKQYRGVRYLFVAPLPQLNDDNDVVLLQDTLGYTLDSLIYTYPSEYPPGRSLEKVHWNYSSQLSSWTYSLSQWYASPGSKNTVFPSSKDATITGLRTIPASPVKGDSVAISVTLRSKSTGSALLIIMIDKNFDGEPDSTVLRKDYYFYDINSIVFTAPTKIRMSDSIALYAGISMSDDEDTSNNSKYITLRNGFREGTVQITEVMSNPSAGNQEWFEILNRTNDTISLSGWKVKDINGSTTIVHFPSSSILLPKERKVVTPVNLQQWYPILPSQQIIMSVPTLNNDYDGLVLLDFRDGIIDSVFHQYAVIPQSGYSREKKTDTLPGWTEYNWGISDDLFGGTPGRVNSVTDKLTDIRISGITFAPAFPEIKKPVTLTANFLNKGLDFSPGFTGTITVDGFAPFAFSVPPIAPGLSSQVSMQVTVQNLTTSYSIMTVVPGDEDETNNRISGVITAGVAPGIVRINEVYVYDMNKFWIELYNPGAESVVLNNWGLIFGGSSSVYQLSTQELSIAPNEYKVFAVKTPLSGIYGPVPVEVIKVNIPYLLFTSLKLIDYRGVVYDEFKLPGNNTYTGYESWELADQQMKQVWAIPYRTAGTPGRQNSHYQAQAPGKNSVVINEIMYNPDDGKCEYIELYNTGSETINSSLLFIEKEGGTPEALFYPNYEIKGNSYSLLSTPNIRSLYSIIGSAPWVYSKTAEGLPESGKYIRIFNYLGETIDSIFYKSSWHAQGMNQKGRSLERISVNGGTLDENWTSSFDNYYSTPGNANSVRQEITVTSAVLQAEPNPFTPNYDGISDRCFLSYNLPLPASKVKVRIFDDRGRLLTTIMDNLPSAQQHTVAWDGLDDNRQKMPMGQYIVLMEATTVDGKVYKEKMVIVIARNN